MSEFIKNLYAHESKEWNDDGELSQAEITSYLKLRWKTGELWNDTENIKSTLENPENADKKTELVTVAMTILEGCNFDSQDRIGSAMISLLFAINYGKQLKGTHNRYLVDTIKPWFSSYSAVDYCAYLKSLKNTNGNVPDMFQENQ